jgi:hypothetical protein
MYMDPSMNHTRRLSFLIVWAAFLLASSITIACKKNSQDPPLKQAKQNAATAQSAQRVLAEEEKSCQAFVQEFYNWYLPRFYNSAQEPSSDDVLKIRPQALSPKLLHMLQEDSEASAKAAGEIVGLDFDPFLNSNGDFGTEARVTRVSLVNGLCRVSVQGYEQNQLEGQVFAELSRKGNLWAFEDFYFDGSFSHSKDLIRTLNELAAFRKKH